MSAKLKLEHYERPELEPNPEFLLLVALRTDQHDVARRLAIILNAAAPQHPRAGAEVTAIETPTVETADLLAKVFGVDVLTSLGWQRP